jgi:glucokinase
MKNAIVMGVDIGGSHITAALINLNTKSVLEGSKVRASVKSQGTETEIVATWMRVIKEAGSKIPWTTRIGIAMPGPFLYESGVSLMKGQEKYDALYNLNIKSILADNLNTEADNIKFINDAECFLLGEAFGGAAKGMDKAIGLTLGTGLGSARFHNGIAEDADLWNSEFLEGIAEDYLSTRWFIKRYYTLSGRHISEVKELVDLTSTNDIKQKIFNEFGQNLANFLSRFIIKEQPESVVLGGNISNAFDLFSAHLIKGLGDLSAQTLVQRAILGEESALIGSACYWLQKEPHIV